MQILTTAVISPVEYSTMKTLVEAETIRRNAEELNASHTVVNGLKLIVKVEKLDKLVPHDYQKYSRLLTYSTLLLGNKTTLFESNCYL